MIQNVRGSRAASGSSDASSDAGRAKASAPHDAFSARPLLGLTRSCWAFARRRDVFERGEMLVDVGLSVLNRNRPLLIPPVRLCHHAAVHHAEPVVTPQVDVNRFPIAVIANLLGIEHESAIGSGLAM